MDRTFRASAIAFLSSVCLLGTSSAYAHGNAPIKIRNGTKGDILVRVDDTGRGMGGKTIATNDGKNGWVAAPNEQKIAPDTNQGDKVTISIFTKDGKLIKTKGFFIAPVGGVKWEQLWNGTEIVDDPNP